MKSAKDMKKTARYKHMVANLKSAQPYEKEAALLKEIAGGKQWRMDAVLEAIQPVEWNDIHRTRVFEQAAMFGRLSTIEQMSKNAYFRFDPKTRDVPSSILLGAFDIAVLHGHYAAFPGHCKVEVADYLLSLGAHPDYFIDNQRPQVAMHYAMKEGDLHKMDYLFKAGANPNFYLAPAVATGDKNLVSHLIRQGADVNFSLRGATPLQMAVHMRKDDIADFLLAKGADPKNSKDRYEILSVAIGNNNLKMVQKLFDLGVTPDKSNLDQATYGKQQEMMDLIAKNMSAPPSSGPAAPKP